MYACVCHGITEHDLRTAIRAGDCTSIADIKTTTGATGCCGSCHEQVAFLLDQEQIRVMDAVVPVLESRLARTSAA